MQRVRAMMSAGKWAGRGLLVLMCAASGAQLCAEAPPDAVIELWEQRWKLNEDGSIVYHNKQHVRLNSDRTYREFADPRITYNVDSDKLEIINARVKRADGTYRELPEYSHVKVSPNSSAGWPAFASIQQHLIVMSGIEPGCVVELEYKITSKAGSKRYLAADVRLDHRYPVKERVLSVDAGPGRLQWTGRGCIVGEDRQPTRVKQVQFKDMAGVPVEPQSPPWQKFCMSLAFSTAPSAEAWVRDTLERIEGAADESDLAGRLAKEWTEGKFQAGEKLRAIQEKLAASFNFVEFDVDWWPAEVRPASETLRGNYGLPEEAAAVFLALARAAEIPVRLGVLADDDVWSDRAPQRSFVAAYVVLLDGGGEAEIWDAHRGRIMRDSRWGGHTLVSFVGEELRRTVLPAWTEADESRCVIGGTVTVDEEGTYAGELSVRTTGLFVSPEGLRSQDAQKSRVTALVHHVLPDVEVKSFNVTSLGAGEFAVEAKVKSSEALKKVGGGYWLALAESGPFMADVPMPLEYSKRTNPIRLTGAFDEQIELTIEWPEGWTVEAQPLSVGAVSGEWGEVGQQVAPGEDRLTLTRHTRMVKRQLSPEAFLALREPLNALRAEAARTVVLKP